MAQVQRVFGGWPRGTLNLPRTTEPPPQARRVIVVDKPDSVQTEIRVGQLAIPRKHKDYLAWDLAVRILGGEGANRLHRVLRSERGLTYGAQAETHSMKQAGDYMAETDTRTDTTGEALRLMVDEFAKIERQRIFERELGDAQAYLAGSFPLTIETPNEIATQVLNNVFYRAAGVGDRHLPRARPGRHARRRAARGAAVRALRSPLDRARGQRQGVRPAAAVRGVYGPRGDSDRGAGLDVGEPAP